MGYIDPNLSSFFPFPLVEWDNLKCLYVLIIYFLTHLSSHSILVSEITKRKNIVFLWKRTATSAFHFRLFLVMLYIIIIRPEIGFVTKNISTKHKKEAVDEI